MKLEALLKNVATINVDGSLDREVTAVAYDSRRVKQGAIFVAMKGEKVDGAQFVENAIAAGAEAIQIGDERVVANTWISERDGDLVVSGASVAPPYSIRAIGDANTLAGAMEIPGGVTATVRRADGTTETEIRDEVVIDALLSLTPPQYARPVPITTP